jgi:polyisoprenoid-binding protein YceI
MSAATAAPERTEAPGKTSWKIDPSHTSVEFSAKHLMITTVRGRISDVEGTIQIDNRNPAKSSVEAVLKAASLDTRSEQRDAHLRSADFLDAERFPEITFKSKRVDGSKEAFKLIGDLTIHGTTKEITLDVIFEGRQKDPWGGDRVGFSASGKIDRRDFGLTWNQVLEAGGVTVSNDIKINIEAQATKEA